MYVGTVALVAMLSEEMRKTLLGEPPYDLLMASASSTWNGRLNVDTAAEHLHRYLQSCLGEMTYVVQALGKRSIAELDRSDLVALDAATADLCGVRLAWRQRVKDQPLQVDLQQQPTAR